MPLCSDHSRGRTPRYSGQAPPRVNCSGCWAIWDKDHTRDTTPVPLGLPDSIEDLKDFRKLTTEAKHRLLLGGTQFRIVGYDIEATNLKPNVGRILCCYFKPLGQEPYGFHALEKRFFRDDVYDDSALAVAIRDELETYDIIVGWNSKQFDYKYVNSRCIRGGERIKVAQPHLDGMWSWRSKFNAWSGLKAVQQFAAPDNETEKTAVAWEQWMRALGWNKRLREEAMAEIVDHCTRDVIVLEDVYRLMVNADVFRSLRKDGGIL